MKSDSLRHDVMWAGGRACLDVIANCIREDEHRDAFEAFAEIINSCLEKYDELLGRTEGRIFPRPSKN